MQQITCPQCNKSFELNKEVFNKYHEGVSLHKTEKSTADHVIIVCTHCGKNLKISLKHGGIIDEEAPVKKNIPESAKKKIEMPDFNKISKSISEIREITAQRRVPPKKVRFGEFNSLWPRSSAVFRHEMRTALFIAIAALLFIAALVYQSTKSKIEKPEIALSGVELDAILSNTAPVEKAGIANGLKGVVKGIADNIPMLPGTPADKPSEAPTGGIKIENIKKYSDKIKEEQNALKGLEKEMEETYKKK